MCPARRNYRERNPLQPRCRAPQGTETGKHFSLGVVLLLLILLTACGGNPTRIASTAGTSSLATTAAPEADKSAEAGGAPRSTRLSVFAAASLADAFNELGRRFEAQNSGVSLSFNYAGSNQLAQQIAHGAPADVFASANQRQMDVVVESGHVVSGKQRTFVRNRLVAIFPTDNPSRITTLQHLANPGIKIVLAAGEVPAGQYALEFLEKASRRAEFTEKYAEAVLANVVSYEGNVRAVLSKVALGEADAGIVYGSDISGDAAEKVGHLTIPDELNTIAAYQLAPIEESKNSALAQRFVEFVLSREAQAVLANNGFIRMEEDD